MKKTHQVGLALWRGGLLLAIGYVVYGRIRALLSIADDELEFAVAVLLIGLLFVFLSLIMERIEDARAEKAGSR